MLEFNTALLKLQYEILNVSLEDIATQLHIPVSIVAADARRGNWRQLWPDEPPILIENLTQEPTLDIEQRTELAQKRLRYYSVMKDQYLSAKYLALESVLLDSAKELLDTGELDATSVHRIAAAFKMLSSGTTLSDYKAQVSQDSGIPTAIVRDVSGLRGVGNLIETYDAV